MASSLVSLVSILCVAGRRVEHTFKRNLFQRMQLTAQRNPLLSHSQDPPATLAALLLGFAPSLSPKAFFDKTFPQYRGTAPPRCTENEQSRVEQLKIQAEKARLLAEKAALEADLLESQVSTKRETVPASPPLQQAGLEGQDSLRVADAVWPVIGKYYRFIPEDDPTLMRDSPVFQGRSAFLGSSKEGVYPGSFRLQFCLPGTTRPKTIELLQSSAGIPLFSAVKVNLPIQIELDRLPAEAHPTSTRQVVKRVEQGSMAESAGIRVNDIIRAISLPSSSEKRQAEAWFQKIWKFGQAEVPESDENMVILDDKEFVKFFAALEENLRVNGREADILLLIERPNTEASADAQSID